MGNCLAGIDPPLPDHCRLGNDGPPVSATSTNPFAGEAISLGFLIRANQGRLPAICLLAPNATEAPLAGWLATSCFT